MGIPWTATEFIVQQFGDIDLVEKEPTVQAASREKGFLGERVDLYSWDDLVNVSNTRSIEVREALAEWHADECETRLEPGGVGLLVGQRLGPADLYRDRLDVQYVDDDGEARRKYQHIVYPAHVDNLCEAGEVTPSGGTLGHEQWNGANEGCLLDAERLPWRELSANRQANPRKFRMLYQQEDVDPAGALVDEAWIAGGTDREGFRAPGCLDLDRGFLQWPQGMRGLIDYVSVDPSAGNFWAIEWWALNPETEVRYLIKGLRSMAFKAGDLLQYAGSDGQLSGVMMDWQAESRRHGHPIRCWVLEGNSAFKHLVGYDHFKAWQRTFGVPFVLHKTGLNKNDEQRGVEALMPPLYRDGKARLPYQLEDRDARRFVDAFTRELITYPDGATNDMVMCQWMAEWNMARIRSAARREIGSEPSVTDAKLPPYLMRQRQEASY